jgi:hypothetical protein
MIAKLKDPKQAQELSILEEYSPKAYQIIIQAGFENCLYWAARRKSWEPCRALQPRNAFTYILKRDYEFEPEYEDREICVRENMLCLPLGKPIYSLPAWPHFVGNGGSFRRGSRT